MKPATWLWPAFLGSALSTTPPTPTPTPTPTSPFHAPQTASPQNLAQEHLFKRADNCPGGYNPCNNLGRSDICCESDARCSADAANNIACCPTGASCTGSLTATDTGAGTGSAGVGNTVSLTGSTIPGAAYPFVVIPSTFADAAACTGYYSLCRSEYAACTASLGGGQGGRYGVTVAGPNGAGVTVGPGASTAPSGAVSVCSSLSMRACHGMNLGDCGSGSNGGNGAVGRRTSVQDLFLGVVVGVAGMFV